MPDKILLVDDEAVFRSYIREMKFWEEGEFCLAGEAKGADEAMRFLKTQEVDTVILDVSMPGKNGVVLSGMIASQYPSVSMIAISSFDNYDYVRQILKNGAHDYILKHRLTEHQLKEALIAVHDKKRGISQWEMKTKLRRQVQEWFFGEGESPFTSDNSRKAIMLVRIFQEHTLTETEKKAITESICKIFEENSTEKADVLALHRGTEQFVILTRFYDRVSEAGIRELMEYNKNVSEDTIRRIYALKMTVDYCPVFFSDSAMRSYVLHKLIENEGKGISDAMALSLTISQQKELFLAIEEGAGEKAGELIHCIFSELSGSEQGACLIIVRELLDLIKKAAAEYQIALDFLPQDFKLYEYAQIRNPEKLSASIAGLYSNVIREIEDKRKNKGYSEIVVRATRFIEDKYGQPISLKIVAAQIGTNSSYLSRVFHDETGKTMTDYLNEVRITAATNMLEDGLAL